jgi:hypothetical protein
VRSFLIATVVASASISGAAAQVQPCPKDNLLQKMGAALSPQVAAQRDLDLAVCEYRNCLAATGNNANACEGLRAIMETRAAVVGHYTGSR